VSEPVLDADVLARLERELGGSPERVAAVLAVYLEEIEPYRADIRAAVERSDSERLEFAAHRLGSASVLVGATRLTTLCRELESLKDHALGERGRELVTLIGSESEAVSAAVRALLDGKLTPEP
jgi:HPt (histidine-containing phosphotransfer) domain-containing protein